MYYLWEMFTRCGPFLTLQRLAPSAGEKSHSMVVIDTSAHLFCTRPHTKYM